MENQTRGLPCPLPASVLARELLAGSCKFLSGQFPELQGVKIGFSSRANPCLTEFKISIMASRSLVPLCARLADAFGVTTRYSMLLSNERVGSMDHAERSHVHCFLTRSSAI